MNTMKKVERTMIALVILLLCCLICAALLLPGTLGRYSKRLQGYTAFKVENFNTAITTPTITEENSSLTTSLTAHQFHPGMVWSTATGSGATPDTAAHTVFRVANGTTTENATSMALQYTVRIRTAKSLPLNYILKSGNQYYRTLGEPTPIEEANTETRYEYRFAPTPAYTDPNEAPEPAGSPALDGTQTEATFTLAKGTADVPLVYRDHELIAEWPADSASASSDYMKEVEIVEILVTVTSLNKEQSGEQTTPPSSGTPEYSDGILWLKPPAAGATSGAYIYEIDLRSFRPQQNVTQGLFRFELNNAVGMGEGTGYYQTIYDMQLKVPMALVTAGYSFTVYRELEDGTMSATNLLLETPSKYQVYNEKTGALSGEFETVEETVGFEQPLYGVYAIYDIVDGDSPVLYNYIRNTAVDYVPAADSHAYLLQINTLEGIDPMSTNSAVTFLNKLELLVATTFTGTPGGSTGGEDAGGEDTGGEDTPAE